MRVILLSFWGVHMDDSITQPSRLAAKIQGLHPTFLLLFLPKRLTVCTPKMAQILHRKRVRPPWSCVAWCFFFNEDKDPRNLTVTKRSKNSSHSGWWEFLSEWNEWNVENETWRVFLYHKNGTIFGPGDSEGKMVSRKKPDEFCSNSRWFLCG